MNGLILGMVWMAVSGAPVLECPKLEGPMTIKLDGAMNDAAWAQARPVKDGGIEVKGAVSSHRLFLGVKMQEKAWPWAKDRQPLDPNDDRSLKEGHHVEIVMSDPNHTEYYRVLVTPGGAVYDVHQKQTEGGWENDVKWSCQSGVAAEVASKTWTVEVALPWLENGDIQVTRKGPALPEPTPQWIHVAVVEGKSTAKPGDGAHSDLSNLSDEELSALAEQQAKDPAAVVKALKMLDFSEKTFAIMADESLSREQLKAKMKELHESGIEEELGMAKVRKMQQEASGKSDEESLEEGVEQIEKMRPMMKATQEMMKPQMTLERAIARSASLGDFTSAIKQQQGEDGFKKLPPPAMAAMMSMSMGGASAVLGGKGPAKMPKTWEEMTEDQYQTMRNSKLQAFTPAGQELFARRLAKFMPGQFKNSGEE